MMCTSCCKKGQHYSIQGCQYPMTATYTMVVKVDTEIIQEASTVTYGIITDVITNTNLSIITENEDDSDTQQHDSTDISNMN